MKMLLVVLISLLFQRPARVLDIYALNRNDPDYVNQMRRLGSDPKGLKERDITIKTYFHHPGFRITLTGKDGGQKYSSDKILELSKLYALIDAMPMRREEMAKRKLQ
ncbi:DUF4174 domain-containing protein [Mucilaginibacter corticis]|uniref:DUF4174 domain-containing protein n=1 Tax=Mucilaginibacter corticis TaxID=2597670 RepID=A0A556MMF3_9SPHI|nr:DUF4174 domain-containing protein [Mucilaginibacter corticis]TSJ41055.1 DUF4174 domain-containing protein [Mucilaginibacter corticis]